MTNRRWSKKELLITNYSLSINYEDFLVKQGYAQRTIQDHQSHLKYLQNQYPNQDIKELRYPDLINYISELQKQVKPQTITQRIQSIKKYYNYLLERDEIDHNPAKRIKIRNQKQSLRDLLKQEELEQLYVEYQPKNPRDKALLGLLIYQAAESGVLQKLKATDINLEQGTILFRSTTRSNKRTLNLHSSQMLPLFKHLQVSQENLFSGRIIDRLNHLLKHLKKQNTKVENIRQIRASVITNWLKIYNLRQVQYMAGHRYVSSTESYQEKDFEALEEGIKKFHPLG